MQTAFLFVVPPKNPGGRRGTGGRDGRQQFAPHRRRPASARGTPDARPRGQRSPESTAALHHNESLVPAAVFALVTSVRADGDKCNSAVAEGKPQFHPLQPRLKPGQRRRWQGPALTRSDGAHPVAAPGRYCLHLPHAVLESVYAGGSALEPMPRWAASPPAARHPHHTRQQEPLDGMVAAPTGVQGSACRRALGATPRAGKLNLN